MNEYKRIVHYYETDKMGVVHHSNYIRWFEEARLDFFKNNGYDYAELEKKGVICPVVSINCNYKHMVTYPENIIIEVSIKEFKGVKLVISYVVKKEDGIIASTGESVHCFIDQQTNRIIRMDKEHPDFYELMKSKIKN